jgi:REP-associated tyrosine transposase
VPRSTFCWLGGAVDLVVDIVVELWTLLWSCGLCSCSFRYRTLSAESTLPTVPWGLKRFQQSGHLHFITFSCYRRQPRLDDPEVRNLFERALEQSRRRWCFLVTGYVVMPEHVHLLISEPEHGQLSQAVQSFRQSVARRLALRAAEPFWQERYYDFNVWSERKRIEKLRYIHRNPVTRGLCAEPQDWPWGSFRHYRFGEEGAVEIESHWTARRREAMGSPGAVPNRVPGAPFNLPLVGRGR